MVFRKLKANFPILLLLALVFIGFGDRFLPEPLKSASANTRTSINNAITGLFPSWRPSLDPHQRTEDAIEQQEGVAPKK